MRKDDDVGGILLLILIVIALPIMLIVWLTKGLTKLSSTTNTNKTVTNEKTNSNKSNSDFSWLSGESDELTMDEVIDIEELLEDDGDFF